MAGRKKADTVDKLKDGSGKLTDGKKLLLSAYKTQYKRLEEVLKSLPKELEFILSDSDLPRSHYNVVLQLPFWDDALTKLLNDESKTFSALLKKYIKLYDKKGFILEVVVEELSDVDDKENRTSAIDIELLFKVRV